MKKIYIYWAGTALAVILGTTAAAQASRISRLEVQIENGYNRAFHELVGYVDDIDTLLQKSMLVSDPAQLASISGELFRQASAAKACLGQLPISEVTIENTEKFLSQVGDYTYYLSQNVIKSEAVGDADYDSLNSLSKYAGILNGKLLEMQSDVYDGKIRFGTIKSKGEKILSTEAHAADDALSGFEGVEKEFQEYPSLIYDGPFSEHIEKAVPVMLENAEEISPAEAKEAAADFLGISASELSLAGESQNTGFSAYSFASSNEAEELCISVTKHGGYPFYFIKNREIGEQTLNISQATQAAREFLYSAGFSSLKDSYFEASGGIATVNFAYEQGGVVCYSDLIKVRVALDNGEILGAELHGYLMNHQYRALPSPVLSEAQASEKINPHLSVENTALALIPKDGQTEKLCYEFTGKHNGRNFIIYINAETGREEKILMLIESEEGVLTV